MQDEFKEIMFSSAPCPCTMLGTVFPRLTPLSHTPGAPPAHRHTFVGCKAHPVPSLPSPPAAAPALKAPVPMAFTSAGLELEQQQLLEGLCHGRGLSCLFQDTDGLHCTSGPRVQCLCLPSCHPLHVCSVCFLCLLLI